MKNVHFRVITSANLDECLSLSLEADQVQFIAPNAVSLAQAFVNPALRPFAVYDNLSLGFEEPVSPMVGFVMVEIVAGTGFILRLMIDRAHQGQGYARATLRATVQYLKMIPEVHLIATSHAHQNTVMSKLLGSEGFTPWAIEYARNHPTETFVQLIEHHR